MPRYVLLQERMPSGGGARMGEAQKGILAPVPPLARYLSFDIAPGMGYSRLHAPFGELLLVPTDEQRTPQLASGRLMTKT